MKNVDVVNKIISEKTNIEEKTVKSVNQYFWKCIRQKMVSAESTAISVKGLCTFHISRYNLNKHIHIIISKIRRLRNAVFYKEHTKLKMIDIQVNRLQTLLKRRNEIAKMNYDKGVY